MVPAPAVVDEAPLVRVDVPDHPDAVVTSRRGSALPAPPDEPGLRWRLEPVPEIDGAVADAAIDALRAGPWHAAGFTGEGVHVAVFDIQFQGWELRADELGVVSTHDCFAHPSCDPPIDGLRPRSSLELGAHGVACAEVVHDVAPGARLSLVRVSGLTSLENAVDWSIREGVDVISMSLSFFNESFYDGTGPVNDLMDDLEAAGVLMVTSAGNSAGEHWAGDFVDADLDGWLDTPDPRGIPISWGSGIRRLNLVWDEFDACGRSDLDVRVLDERGRVVGRAERPQRARADDCQPVERVDVTAAEEGWFFVQIHRTRGSGALRLDLTARGGSVEGGVPEGSITDPGNHPSVFTVGAARARGYSDAALEGFSSRGPTHGGLPKPDVVGPNGLTTLTYGADGFFGTSASTPAVVGAIALLMSEDPRLGARGAAERLRDTAVRHGPTWEAPDPGLGAGRVVLPPPGAGEVGCAPGQVLPMGLLVPLGGPFGALWWGARRRRPAPKPPLG